MKCLSCLLLAVLFSIFAHGQKYDLPEDMMKGEGNQIWGTRVVRTGKGYRSHVLSRLNGKVPLNEEPDARIASGTTGVWQWEVRTVPSLVPSYEQWTNDPKV